MLIVPPDLGLQPRLIGACDWLSISALARGSPRSGRIGSSGPTRPHESELETSPPKNFISSLHSNQNSPPFLIAELGNGVKYQEMICKLPNIFVFHPEQLEATLQCWICS